MITQALRHLQEDRKERKDNQDRYEVESIF